MTPRERERVTVAYGNLYVVIENLAADRVLTEDRLTGLIRARRALAEILRDDDARKSRAPRGMR